MESIILLVGASGSGKTTIANSLESRYGYKQISSYTTRPPRTPNEKGHIFVTNKVFDTLEPDMVGFTNFNGWRYCATTQQVEENDIYVIDPDGVNYFKSQYKGSKIPVVIYVQSNPILNMYRMYKRGDKPRQILSRLKNDFVAFRGFKKKADKVIHNNDEVNIACQSVILAMYGIG